MKGTWKKSIAGVLLLAPLFGTVFADDITVRLSNHFGNKTSSPFTVDNTYRISNDTDVLQKGITYTVKTENGMIGLYEGPTKIASGNPIELIPSDEESLLKIGSQSYQGEMKFAYEGGYIRPYNTLDFEDYLKGVVPREMPNSWGKNGGIEALKSQAISARTYAYAKGFLEQGTIKDTTEHQVYGGFDATATEANQAVEATEGEILHYNGKPIVTYFSSSNGGYIESNANVWNGSELAYLKANEDIHDPKNFYELPITQNEMITLLQTKTSIRIQSVNAISVIEKTSGQRAKTLRFDITATDGNNHSFTMKATDFRTLVGNLKLKSTYFSSPTFSNGVFTFSGQGFGHGVGMSQHGAYEMSKKGFSYRDILQHYYPGTTLQNFVKPVFLSSRAYQYQSGVYFDYSTDKDSKVLIDIRTLSGDSVMVIEPYVIKNAGSHTAYANASHLNGTYKARIILMKKDSGEVTDSYTQTIYMQPKLPSFSKGMMTSRITKGVQAYEDGSRTQKSHYLYPSEQVKVIASYGNTYEIVYNGKTLFVEESAIKKEKKKDIRISVNGYELNMDEKPRTVSNRVLIPIRFVSNGLGMEVKSWNAKTKTALISKSGKTISLTVGKKTATVDGKQVTLDASIVNYNGRLFVPLRFVSEQMGAYVHWDVSQNMIWVKD